MKNLSKLILILLFTFPLLSDAKNIVNVYVWGDEIPKNVLDQFEKETGIHVNFSTYDSNETMIAKLRAQTALYDVISPSAYFVDRLKRQHALMKLDPLALPNQKHLEKQFQTMAYDPHNEYSIPLTWGASGIFYNQKWIKHPPKHWKDLWNKRWVSSLLLLDDCRDVFAMSAFVLGLSPNTQDPNAINTMYRQLLKLIPNIQLFASEGIQSMLTDEEALIGMAWNGDIWKVRHENPSLRFIYPKEGFIIWIDALAIPAHAPHPKEAHAFINFLLKPEIAAQIALQEGHAITNETGKNQLPKALSHHSIMYPSPDILSRGVIQSDIGEKTLQHYNHYWQLLKLSFS